MTTAESQIDLDIPPHTTWDDVAGILTGTFMASLGIFLLKSADVVTGGTAGAALLLSYLLDHPFGTLFLLVNVPFFALAVWKKGWNFTIRTMASVSLVSAFSHLHAQLLGTITPSPLYAAIGGNLLVGVGLLILFRHKSSLGGFNIIALLAQERLGWRAGYVQLALDSVIVLSALAVVPPANVVLSACGAIVLNMTLATNHRPGRYLGH